MGKQRFPPLSLLLEFVNTIPVHTASVERGFSTLSRLKTKPRSSLEEDNLNCCMTIVSSNLSVEEWSVDAAKTTIQRWFTHTAGRRHVAGHAKGSGRRPAAQVVDLGSDSHTDSP